MRCQHYFLLSCVISLSTLNFTHAHNAPEDYVKAHNEARKQVGVGLLKWDEDYVKAHNEARKQVGVGLLKWDATVAKFAESYANQRKDKYGENIAFGSGEFSGLDAVKLWVDEKVDYDYNSNSCKFLRMCAHYTQVVWKNSSRIGCARVKCVNDAYFVTCNYEPPGNYIGEKPY